MSLQNVVRKVREDCLKILATRRLSQQEFSQKHGLSHSWVNKFLNNEEANPRVQSVERLREAVAEEKRAS